MILGIIIYLVIGLLIAILHQIYKYNQNAFTYRVYCDKDLEFFLIIVFYPIYIVSVGILLLYTKFDDWCYEMALVLKKKGRR